VAAVGTRAGLRPIARSDDERRLAHRRSRAVRSIGAEFGGIVETNLERRAGRATVESSPDRPSRVDILERDRRLRTSGHPAVSRQEDDDERSENCESETTVFDDGESTPSSDENATNADEFGTLSGTSKTARIDNDSFGTALEPQSDDDRYRALGAALDAGGAVSVRGLLEDDEFLPELPTVESNETRIEFADGCAPVDVPRRRRRPSGRDSSGSIPARSRRRESRISSGAPLRRIFV